MKKKFISLLSVSLGVLISSSFVTACNNDRPLHIWAEDWTYNNATHWHACTDAGCPGKDSYDYHDFELLSTEVEPTCTKEGKGHFKCNVCGYEKDDSIPVIPHNYKLVQTLLPPSCIYEGRGTYKCSVCGHSEDLQIPATGKHSFGSSYGYDETTHWRICLIEGCGATDNPMKHTAGKPNIVNPDGWSDGSMISRCTVCSAVVNSKILESKKAPVSYDIELEEYYKESKEYISTGVKVAPVPGDIEDEKQTYKLTLTKDNYYKINLLNAVNCDGTAIYLDGDTNWQMGDIYQCHGIKVYQVDMRSGKEAQIVPDQGGAAVFHLYEGPYLRVTNVGEYKIIFRYETGVNDGNGNTRKIRVEHVIYVTVTEA